MTEKETLQKEIEELKAKRDRLLGQVDVAEFWEEAALDVLAMEEYDPDDVLQMEEPARNYWDVSLAGKRRSLEFVIDQANRVKRCLAEKRYDLLEKEVDYLVDDVYDMADDLGVGIAPLKANHPYFNLPEKGE